MPIGVFVPGLALLWLGFSVWRASAVTPAAFQSPADARFVIGAGIDPRVVFAWLALHTARRFIISFVLILVLPQILYLPLLGFDFTHAILITSALTCYAGVVFGARTPRIQPAARGAMVPARPYRCCRHIGRRRGARRSVRPTCSYSVDAQCSRARHRRAAAMKLVARRLEWRCRKRVRAALDSPGADSRRSCPDRRLLSRAVGHVQPRFRRASGDHGARRRVRLSRHTQGGEWRGMRHSHMLASPRPAAMRGQSFPARCCAVSAVIAALPIAVTVFATAGLIAIATWRIDGNGMAVAREERQ